MNGADVLDVKRTSARMSVPVIVEADAGRLAQALDNLMRNALDAMPDGGTLTLGCSIETTVEDAADGLTTPARRAVVRVADTGAGIALEERAHVFEPFYTKRATGTGLGLAIAREIVEAHGGAIRVDENDAPRGAIFRIELPMEKE